MIEHSKTIDAQKKNPILEKHVITNLPSVRSRKESTVAPIQEETIQKLRGKSARSNATMDYASSTNSVPNYKGNFDVKKSINSQNAFMSPIKQEMPPINNQSKIGIFQPVNNKIGMGFNGAVKVTQGNLGRTILPTVNPNGQRTTVSSLEHEKGPAFGIGMA
jgi:hypothetical protein